MAGKLEKMLQPGERVVFRTRPAGAWAARRWVRIMVFVAVLHAALAWFTGEWLFLLPQLFLLIIPLGVAAVYGQMAVAVTDGRILCMRSKKEVEAIPLRLIARIEMGGDGVTLISLVERRIPLPDLPDPDGLAAAIVAATGLPTPETLSPRQRRLAAWASRLPISGAALGYVLSFVAYDWLSPIISEDHLFTVMLTAFAAAPVLGFAAGLVAALALLRANLTAAETRQILSPNGVEDGMNHLRVSGLWVRLIYRLATRLHGQRA